MPNSNQESASDQRAATRASLYLAASLYFDGASAPVKIRNISSTGALLECPIALPAAALVQLVRGSLIVHGLIAWSQAGEVGIKFFGSIDVDQWRMAPRNAEQQRVDDIVKLVKAGAVPLPVSEPCSLPSDLGALSVDLRRASELLGNLGDRLAKDGIVVALFPAELQNLDIAMQVIDAVGVILAAESDGPMDAMKFENLRKSADQALSRAAA